MSLPIISADERLAENRGIKGCIFGKSGIGKTSLLWTLDPDRTLFMDLEAGDLAIAADLAASDVGRRHAGQEGRHSGKLFGCSITACGNGGA